MNDLTSKNWSVSNTVAQPQWESGNLGVSFPFADNTLPVGFPTDVIVDACIIVPTTIDRPNKPVVTLNCLHISPSMVSVVISAGETIKLHCCVLSANFSAFSPVKLESITGECSGFITFGDLRFDTIYTIRGEIPFSDSAVMYPVVGRLEKFVQPASGNEATDIVGIELPAGVSLTIENQKYGHNSIVQFTADDSVRNLLQHPCIFETVPNDTPLPISSINGIKPDEFGRIAIVFASKLDEVPK